MLLARDVAPRIRRQLALHLGRHGHLSALQLHHTLTVSGAVLRARGQRQEQGLSPRGPHSPGPGRRPGAGIEFANSKEASAPPASRTRSPGGGAGSGPAAELFAPHGPATAWIPGRSPRRGRRWPPSSPLPVGTEQGRRGAHPPPSFPARSPGPAGCSPHLPLDPAMQHRRASKGGTCPSPQASFPGWASPAPRARGCRTGSRGWTGGGAGRAGPRARPSLHHLRGGWKWRRRACHPPSTRPPRAVRRRLS